MIKTDLHMHSTYSSDGQHTVSELLSFVKNCNINLFSITDHNNIDSAKEISEIFKYSDYFVKGSLNFITGIEFSTYYKGDEIHLLAYGADFKSDTIKDLLKKFTINRNKQMELRVENLKKLGFQIELEEVVKKAEGKTASGVTFLNVLKSHKENIDKLYDYLKGEKSDSPYTKFYFDYFFKNGLAYVDIVLLDYMEVVEAMRNEAVLVIAHPGLYPVEIINDLVVDGIDGIEVSSTYHNKEKIDFFKKICEENNLIKTSGSDFHGDKIKPGIKIGQVDSLSDEELVKFFQLLKEKGSGFYFLN
jgi:predicted metal-dependent phosphoesterase TrpH